MLTVVIGFLVGSVIIFQALTGVSQDAHLYLNLFSFILVAGGSASAALMSITWSNLRELVQCLKEVFFKASTDEEAISKEIILISEKAAAARKISALEHRSNDALIQKGVRLLQSEVDAQNMRVILYSDIGAYKIRMGKNSDLIRSISKYPPAFGMIGTILGLIGLLEQMSLSTGMEAIGIKMALALVTTLYGLLIANYVLVPISEVMINKSQLELSIKKKIVDTLVMISVNKNDPVIVREYLVNLTVDDEVKIAEAA